MRARSLKPSLFKNELLGTADPLLTILFEGLWCEADREGRLEDRPMRIKAEIFPYRENLNIEAQLQWLQENGFITRYVANGLKLIQVLTFLDHQRPHKNEVVSVLPSLEQSSTTKVRKKHNQGTKSAQPNTQALCSDSGLLTPSSLTPDSGLLTPHSPMDAPSGLDVLAWRKWIEYRRERKPAIKAISISAAMREMAALDSGQMAAVEHSIANGWQGLVAPKANGSAGWQGKPSRKPKTVAELEAEEASRAQH